MVAAAMETSVKMEPDKTEITRATARLPGLHIELTHRRAANGNAEQTFGRAFEDADPFALWAQGAQAAWLAAWLPWLEAARMMGLPSTLPWAIAPARPRPPGDG